MFICHFSWRLSGELGRRLSTNDGALRQDGYTVAILLSNLPMPKLTDAQIAKATGLFVGSNPLLAVRLATITQAEADNLGSSIEELRKVETFAAIDKFARARGQDPTDLLFILAADNADELAKLRRERHEEMQRSLGLE